MKCHAAAASIRRHPFAILAAITILASAIPVPVHAKTAACRVESGKSIAFSGPCQFLAEAGGSFSLSAMDKQRPLYEGILVVSVYITGPGQAEVSGLTKNGNNSRWGAAVRMKTDTACWLGEDFKVCAH